MNSRRIRFLASCWLLGLALCGLQLRATNSDSVDVVRYHIHIDTLVNNLLSKTMHAHTDIRLVSKVNSLTTIALDLLRYQVDSVKVNGTPTPITYNDTLLRLFPANAAAMGDTVDVTVWYQGRSVLDAGGFGGLYFVTNYVFNLGV